MSFLDKLLGRPMASSEAGNEEISSLAGVPVLGLGALSSIAYGPETALVILSTVGLTGTRHLPIITIAILGLLTLLYFSYMQTIAAYPNGGGAYTIAKENLGTWAGIFAASALLLDYLLNVAVGISAGVAALVSAFPSLHRHMLLLCLFALAILTFANLRGVRESGFFFGIPLILFVGFMGVVSIIGALNILQSGGRPQIVAPIPALPPLIQALNFWLLLRAFAGGCTAMTGVEAVSNAIPIFRAPKVKNARITLSIIVALLAIFLLFIAFLCPAYHIGAMDQQQPICRFRL
jgi:amino acid transporter